jgi:uncharacterized repeat protein (TIGR01451 family)
VVITVNPTAPTLQVTNTAHVYSDADPNAANDEADVQVEIRGNDPSQADLEITKTASVSSIYVNHEFTYTVNVTNNGFGDATGVTVNDTLPSQVEFVSSTPALTPSGQDITWDIGDLAKGATVTLEITVKAVTTGSADNTATVSGTSGPDSGNDSDTVSVTIQEEEPLKADLVVTKTASSSTVTVGDNFTYSITVENLSLNESTGVNVWIICPATDMGIRRFLGSYDPATGNWTIGTLAGQATATLVITVTALVSEWISPIRYGIQ